MGHSYCLIGSTHGSSDEPQVYITTLLLLNNPHRNNNHLFCQLHDEHARILSLFAFASTELRTLSGCYIDLFCTGFWCTCFNARCVNYQLIIYLLRLDVQPGLYSISRILEVYFCHPSVSLATASFLEVPF